MWPLVVYEGFACHVAVAFYQWHVIMHMFYIVQNCFDAHIMECDVFPTFLHHYPMRFRLYINNIATNSFYALTKLLY